jgi:DnaJ-class molecular chaperone
MLRKIILQSKSPLHVFKRSIFINPKVNDDPYYILGIEKDAEMKEVKRAYFELAKKHHPDMNPNDDAASKQFL